MAQEFSDPNPVGLPTGREFTNTMLNSRRLIRSVKNPMDRCTIVSIFPKDIHEVKYTIEPGIFDIPAGTIEKPSSLVVGSSSWWKDIDVDQPMLEIPVSSISIADSVIKDYCNGILGCNMADSMPGLFFILGEHNIVDVKLKYKKKLDEVNEKQNNWYRILIKLADSLWARSNNNPLVICSEMRLAATSLGLDKVWVRDYAVIEKIPCIACGQMKDPRYPVCQMCKAIDLSHPEAKNIKFAV